MKEVSALLFSFLNSQSAFTDVIGAVGGLRKLYPVSAPSETPLPFSTYRILETKDADSYALTLATYFPPDGYDACVDFSDSMKSLFRQYREFEWVSSEVDQDEQALWFISYIDLNITK
jgi:hypothetical protein